MINQRKLIRTFISEIAASLHGARVTDTSNVMWHGHSIKQEKLKDEADDTVKVSLCVVFLNGKVLCVSRGPGSQLFGFPGGKREIGECGKDAAIRELKEETGLDTEEISHITTIKNDSKVISYYKIKASGTLVPSEEGDLALASVEEMKDSANFPWAEYNKLVFQEIGY